MAFVGRDPELARIRAALARAREEQPSLLLLTGDAGAGKTTLLHEALDAAADLGFTVALGASVDGEAGRTYAPLRAAFRALPEVAEALVAHGEPSATDQSVLEAIGRVPGPLVLAVEDLHWADRSTLELLSFLARNLGAERLLLLGTVRTDDLDPASPTGAALAELGRLRSTERIELVGLDRAAIGELMAAALGRTPDDRELDDLVARSGGNPFYAVELLDARSSRPGELPPSVRDVLTLRLARLPTRAVDVVGAASVVGPVVDVELLAEVLELPAREVERALRSAVDAGVLVVDPASGELRFRHALLREVAYGELFTSERQRLHAATVAVLGRRSGVDPAQLAHHHVLAGSKDEALSASLAAARAGGGTSWSVDAIAHYRTVVDLWPDVADAEARTGTTLVDVLEEATKHAFLVAELEAGTAFAEALLDRLDPADDPERWGLAAVRLSELRWEAGDQHDASTLLARAELHLAGRPASEAAVRVAERHAFHAASGAHDPDAPRLAQEALRLAQEVGDPELECVARNRIGVVHVAHARAEGWDAMRASVATARLHRLPQELVRSSVNLLLLLHAAGQLDEALRMAGEFGEAADELGVPLPHRVGVDAALARVLLATGHWDRAADLLAASPGARYPRYRAYLAVARAELAVGRGDGDEVEAALAEAVFPNILLLGLHAQTFRAEQALSAHQPAEVRRLADELLPLAELIPETTVLKMCAFALHTSPADPDGYLTAARAAAAAIRRRGPELPRDLDAWEAVVVAAHADATGCPSSAHWAEASTWFTAGGFRVRAAWADVYRAAALVKEGGDRDVATSLAADVHALAVEVGARPLREVVEDLVRRARLDVPGVARATDGDLGLTAREAEVLRLVAEGRSNREIGELLYISAKTASVHVSNILRKVGAANRAEATAVASRHGLLAGSV